MGAPKNRGFSAAPQPATANPEKRGFSLRGVVEGFYGTFYTGPHTCAPTITATGGRSLQIVTEWRERVTRHRRIGGGVLLPLVDFVLERECRYAGLAPAGYCKPQTILET